MKSPDKPSHQPTRTHKTEYGYFIKQIYSSGKKRRQKTIQLKKNSKKVILNRIGDLEIYVIPSDFPDKAFIGIYPMSITISESDLHEIIRTYNILKWYFKGQWQRKKTWRKGANSRRSDIVMAYNSGSKRLTDQENDLVPEQLNYTIRGKK